MLEKIKELLSKANAKGIPTPMMRDPLTGVGSVSLTMLFISFNVVLVSLGGKLAGKFGGVNTDQAIYFFTICSGLYFARKMTSDKGKVTIEAPEQKKDQTNA